jgi:ribosomal protein S18 acetylase RimI-like enzyme
MFLTDRVSLDPCLGQDLAARRYRNWISTEFDKGHSEICFIESNGKLVGFAMFRTEGGHLDYLLGGIFPAFMKMGFGPQIVVQPLELARQLGLKGMSTSVSSNNTSVAAIYAHFGFDVKIPESKYIFSYLR